MTLATLFDTAQPVVVALMTEAEAIAEKRFDTSQRRWFYYWHREDLTLLASLADVNAVTMTDRAA